MGVVVPLNRLGERGVPYDVWERMFEQACAIRELEIGYRGGLHVRNERSVRRARMLTEAHMELTQLVLRLFEKDTALVAKRAIVLRARLHYLDVEYLEYDRGLMASVELMRRDLARVLARLFRSSTLSRADCGTVEAIDAYLARVHIRIEALIIAHAG